MASESRDTATATGEAPEKEFHIFGNGISFSISPVIHNAGFQHDGLPYVYDIRQSEDMDGVGHLIQADTFGGASVTMPHKLQAHRFCDRLTNTAEAIGAVNTLIVGTDKAGKKSILGDNTDWSGLFDIVEKYKAKTQVPLRTGLVIGAGGASRAALYTLHQAGVQTIYLVNRTQSSAEAIQAAFQDAFSITILPSLAALPEKPDIVVGTIPADKTTEDQFDTIFGARGLCIDMAYKPRNTPLLQVAQRHKDWTTVTGLQVLLAQAFDQYRLWTGREPPKQVMGKAVMAHEASLGEKDVDIEIW